MPVNMALSCQINYSKQFKTDNKGHFRHRKMKGEPQDGETNYQNPKMHQLSRFISIS